MNARRRARGEDVAGFERHHGREIGDLIIDIVDHVASRRALLLHAVDRQPHFKRMRIGDFIIGREPRTDGAMRVERLAEGVSGRPELPVPRCKVVGDEIARNDTASLVA
jgi:hypothetical protein